MIPEEMERLMQFIIEHQAQFSVDMDKAKERMARHEESMAESDVRLTRIEGIQENTARQIEHLGNALVALTDSHEQTRAGLKELAALTQELAESQTQTQGALKELAQAQAQAQAALKELAESQAHSDRRLDALIDIVRGDKERGQ